MSYNGGVNFVITNAFKLKLLLMLCDMKVCFSFIVMNLNHEARKAIHMGTLCPIHFIINYT